MRRVGVAARYPAVDAKHGLVNLESRINLCRVEQQKAPAFPYESRELLALSAYLGNQSRGMPIQVGVDEKSKTHVEAGKAAFQRRQGQVNLACMSCHDQNAGKRLAGSVISQAHPTGYPIYRLEWQALGSLELVELELYLMWRANGMKLETPAVRP